MGYTALYRKWRPATFEEVRGQDHIVTTLKNQINNGRIGHAYLFCGTRGTGKTSIAKIFARAVNCEHPADGSPCGECASCKAIAAGASMNVVEIDAASNNGVDNVRQIRDEVEYSPADGRYRVYIIDEVHMLTPAAFNALLKTLEEPPSYVIFILATTDTHRIPITVLSRCQKYDFRRIDGDTITARLREMAQAEGIDAEEKAIRYVAKKGDGSLRDAISLFDQCAAFYYGEKLTFERVLDVLGAVDNEVYSHFLRLIHAKDAGACLRQVEELILGGRDLTQFAADFVWYMRGVLLAQTGEVSGDVLDMGSEDTERLIRDASIVPEDTVMRYIRVLSETMSQMRYSGNKRVLLEIALIKLMRPAMETNLDSLLQRLDDLEERLAARTAPEVTPQMLADALAANGMAIAAAAAQGTDTGLTVKTAESGRGEREPETVVLPQAEIDQLRLLQEDWKDIIAAVGLSARTTLTGVQLEPLGEGRLLLVFHDQNAYDMGSRESIRHSLENYIATAYQIQVQIETRLVKEQEYVKKQFVTEDELKQRFNVDIIME
ncbi:MAG: DNA polymerase III subunit gamma/tau [Lachnospiraceae bacterium]|jgi:DNA polymerase-3 subunit gamma/tau|nr:DNA polymerase III subunit gamma/tau [Lachnospiraceae bacterium]